jgi:uncharacterized protein (DUF2141 family)
MVATMLAMFLMTVGCGKDDPVAPVVTDNGGPDTPAQAFIAGTITLPPGTAANLYNARVAVYDSPENFQADAWVAQAAAVGGGQSYSFQVGPLNPGVYYLDIWKDNNSTGAIDHGDWYGAYTTNYGDLRPIQVLEGETTTINFVFSPGKAVDMFLKLTGIDGE